MTSYLTARDVELLETLGQVAFLPFGEIRKIWWRESYSERAARKRLKWLKQCGLLVNRVMNLCRRPTARLLSWHPDDPAPDFARILARTEESTWATSMPVETFEATALGANCFGYDPWTVPQLVLRQGHLLLADAFVHYRLQHPDKARRWAAIRGLSNQGAAACFLNADERPCHQVVPVVVPVRSRLERLHERCRVSRTSYELWGGTT